jgi:hypothetical protein
MPRIHVFQSLALICIAAVASADTLTFTQGVGGFTGSIQNRVSDVNPAEILSGSSTSAYLLDGAGTNSDDIQDLIRFDGIIGNGANQIPTNAIITSAELVYIGGSNSTGGPVASRQVLVNWDGSVSWDAAILGNNGPNDLGVDVGTVQGPFLVGGSTDNISSGDVARANVRQIVQNWVAGDPNFGFNVQTRTTDGWDANTIGNSNTSLRPSLVVEFETPANDSAVIQHRFQQGVNGYTGTTSSLLTTGSGADGAGIGATFLDGDQTAGQMLIKFDDIFGSGANQIASFEKIEKAYLRVNTGTGANATSNGDYSAAQLTTDWTPANAFSVFGSDGAELADGEIGEFLDTVGYGKFAGTDVYFDVTEAVEAWFNGEDNYGLNIQAVGTGDGWEVNFPGASESLFRPELIVITSTPEPAAILVWSLLGVSLVWLRSRFAKHSRQLG